MASQWQKRSLWRDLFAIIAFLLLSTATILWIFNSEHIIHGYWSDILSIGFTVLGVIFAFLAWLSPFFRGQSGVHHLPLAHQLDRSSFRMGDEASKLIADLVEIVRPLIQQKVPKWARNQPLDSLEINVFKFFRLDIDGDDQEEICFAAGIRTPGDFLYLYEGIWLLDPLGDSFHVFDLAVPSSENFRDLLVRDINNDHIPEIVFWFQIGSGAYLSLYIFQWDGNRLISLFPMPTNFSKGFVEMKDLDVDGIDEIVIWEDIFDEGANWDPKRFRIHVFHYNGRAYALKATHQTERHYRPNSIVSQKHGGLMGLPVHFNLRNTPVEEYERRLNDLVRKQQVNVEFMVELDKYQAALSEEAFYEESLAITDLALEATEYLLDALKRPYFRIMLYQAKAATLYQLGNFPQAAHSYLQALSNWPDDPSVAVSLHASLLRMLGAMYAFTYDFEHALAALSAAQALLNTSDLSSQESQVELAKLYSNFAITYSLLGDASLAIMAFNKAIALDQQLERFFAVAINYIGMGNVQRATEKYQDAIQSYHSALEALNLLSERDREADAYLELGITLIVLGQLKKGLNHLQKSLLLTSNAGLMQQGAKHYLYLGEAYKQMRDLRRAERFYKKALQLAEELNVPETQWQAHYGLASISQHGMRLQEAEHSLSAAIQIIEQLRSQYLPEQLKLSLLASGRTKPYETIMLLCFSQSRFENAYDYVERAKSRIFVEQLAYTTVGGFEALPADLVQQETALVDQLRSLQLRDRATASQQIYEWGNEITQC